MHYTSQTRELKTNYTAVEGSSGSGDAWAHLGARGELPETVNTAAHEFQSRGFNTVFVGKWGIDNGGPPGSGYGPTNRGFDEFYGLYNSGHNHFTKKIMYDGNYDWHHNKGQRFRSYPELDREDGVHSTEVTVHGAWCMVHGAFEGGHRAHNRPNYSLCA